MKAYLTNSTENSLLIIWDVITVARVRTSVGLEIWIERKGAVGGNSIFESYLAKDWDIVILAGGVGE